jgi:hypothetical protein
MYFGIQVPALLRSLVPPMFSATYPEYEGRRFLHKHENLTAEISGVTFHMTAMFVATAMRTSDLTI